MNQLENKSKTDLKLKLTLINIHDKEKLYHQSMLTQTACDNNEGVYSCKRTC